MRRLLPPIVAMALATGVLLALPGAADAQPDVCRPGFVLLSGSLLCTPDPNAQAAPAAPAQPAPAPAPSRSVLDRLLGRNRPAPPPAAPPPAPPVAPMTTTAAPAPPAPVYSPPPAPGPAAPPPAVLPLQILPPPGMPIPNPSERTIWLHTCVDLYAANTHLLQIDNQQIDVPPLAYVLFLCASQPNIIPLIPLNPGPPVPGQPPSAGAQTVFGPNVPVTG